MSVKTVALKIPEIGLIAGTRVALGVGIGLMLAGKIDRRQRKNLAWTLVTVGGLSTIPLVINVIRKAKRPMELAA